MNCTRKSWLNATKKKLNRVWVPLALIFLVLVFVRQSCQSKPIEQLNPGTVQVIDPAIYSKVVAISDVHGMFVELSTLLTNAKIIDSSGHWVAGKTLFVVTGDSIDKGPSSSDVVDFWMRLQKEAPLSGGLVIHTLGNHEAEFLADPDNRSFPQAFVAADAKFKLKRHDFSHPTPEQVAFIKSEPLAAKIGNWLFCHSGYYPDMTWADFSVKARAILNNDDYTNDLILGDQSILMYKKWERDQITLSEAQDHLANAGFFGVVFGHQPGAFGVEGRSGAFVDGHFIKIDNGMAPSAGSHQGSLLVFTNPAQMNLMAYPSVEVVSPDGTHQALVPEDFSFAKSGSPHISGPVPAVSK